MKQQNLNDIELLSEQLRGIKLYKIQNMYVQINFMEAHLRKLSKCWASFKNVVLNIKSSYLINVLMLFLHIQFAFSLNFLTVKNT